MYYVSIPPETRDKCVRLDISVQYITPAPPMNAKVRLGYTISNCNPCKTLVCHRLKKIHMNLSITGQI